MPGTNKMLVERRPPTPVAGRGSPKVSGAGPGVAQLARLQANLDASPRVQQMQSVRGKLGRSSSAVPEDGVVQGKWTYNRDLADFNGTVIYYDPSSGLIYDPNTQELKEFGEEHGKILSLPDHVELMQKISKDVDDEDIEQLKSLGFTEQDIEELEGKYEDIPIVFEEPATVDLRTVKSSRKVNIIDELGTKVALDLTPDVELGKEIDTSSLDSKSGEKTAFELANDDGKALIIKRHVMPNSLALHEEVQTMNVLRDTYGLPVAKVHAMGAVSINDVFYPALLMDKYEGSSKMIGHNKGAKYVQSENAQGIVPNLNAEQALDSLESIRGTLNSKKIAIPDLQFLIDDESNFVINDPNGFVTAKQNKKEFGRVFAQNMEMISGLMSTIKSYGRKPKVSNLEADDISDTEDGPDLDYWESEVKRAETTNAPKLTSSILKRIEQEPQTPEILELIRRLRLL